MATLKQTLKAAGILTGNDFITNENQDLESLLQSRLDGFAAALGLDLDEVSPSLDVRSNTGLAALLIIERINGFLLAITPKADDKPLLGTKDFLVIRTSLSLIFKWAAGPVLANLTSAWLSGEDPSIKPKSTRDDISLLADISKRLLYLLVTPDGSRNHFTEISAILVDKHFSDTLEPALAIGWLPKFLLPVSVSGGYAEIRASTMRLVQL
jgi:hypothetical protein